MKLKLTQKNFFPIVIAITFTLLLIWSLMYSLFMLLSLIGGLLVVVGVILVLTHINDNLPEK
jgi:hypothetical protein